MASSRWRLTVRVSRRLMADRRAICGDMAFWVKMHAVPTGRNRECVGYGDMSLYRREGTEYEGLKGVSGEGGAMQHTPGAALQHSHTQVMHNRDAKALTLSLLIGGGLQVQPRHLVTLAATHSGHLALSHQLLILKAGHRTASYLEPGLLELSHSSCLMQLGGHELLLQLGCLTGSVPEQTKLLAGGAGHVRLGCLTLLPVLVLSGVVDC
ncbi:hypothetical protein E2C01_028668 [Portunus trituberculatus]|uniref:Uncharacterized protein n=1 Tax=Portunus trituberculatus TaxID=210409 RepID=A0A5B7EL26_PORTR|nr:hypothetical protein [Portunus trituberculatus]